MKSEYIEKVIDVADIQEFPTELGSRCLLLSKLNLNAYCNTEEEILEALETTAKDPEYLKICLEYSRCRGFYEQFKDGKTPFFEQDKIKVAEFEGKYWVTEGKHRVCMAKRMGIEKIRAAVYQLKEDVYSRLSQVGNPGNYKFYFRKETISSDFFTESVSEGEIALLWLGMVKDKYLHLGTYLPIPLHWTFNNSKEWIELVDGIKVKIETNFEEKANLFGKRTAIVEIKSEVVIEPNHKKTRVWLFSVKTRDKNSNIFTTPLSELELSTLYRTGCFRKMHESVLNRTLIK